MPLKRVSNWEHRDHLCCNIKTVRFDMTSFLHHSCLYNNNNHNKISGKKREEIVGNSYNKKKIGGLGKQLLPCLHMCFLIQNTTDQHNQLNTTYYPFRYGCLEDCFQYGFITGMKNMLMFCCYSQFIVWVQVCNNE